MCGIAGIINKTPRTFDYATFCTLGISNDARGGDSCGVFIDGKYEYGVDKNKFFSSYFQNSDLLLETQKSSVALVHCRKASVGTISEKTAQPVVITDEKGKVEFVVIHNGTIYNYEQLAKKYIPNIDIKGMTDSQVMTRIFYYCGYEVLNEYNGGAVFVIVDYRNGSPRTLIFRGASKKYDYSKEIEAERPLYFCIDKVKRELVFSSIWMYLMALRKDLVTYAVRTNELLEFNGTGLVTIAKYSREKMKQSKEVVTGTYPAYPAYSAYGGKYAGYSEFHEDDWFNSDTYNTYDNYVCVDLLNNLYSYRGKRIHGKLAINNYGRVGGKTSDTCDIWFFNGVALKNKSCFNFLTSYRTETKLSDREFFHKFETVIRYLSIDQVYPSGGSWYKAVYPNAVTLFTGVWQPLTSVTTISYNNGKRVGTIYKGSYGSIKSKINDKLELNFKAIREECKVLMK